MNELPVKIRVEIINEKVESLRKDFEEFIKDTSRPLAERWKVFREANIALSNEYKHIPRFIKDEVFKTNLKTSNYGRGEVINIVDLIDCDLHDTVELPAELRAKDDSDEELERECQEAVKALNPLREEVLQINMKSFCYDW